MSRPTNLELLPPWANVIDASPPVAFSVEVEVPGPSVYVVPADEMPTFPTQRIPGEVDFWAQVDLTVRQKIRAPQDVTLGGNVDLIVESAVKLPAVQFGFEVTFSVVSSFRYVRAVQFSGASVLEAASVVQLPAAFTGRGDLAVKSAVNLPALFGGEVTLSIEAEGGFQLADVDFAGEVTFSVESRVRFVRTVDFSASVALAAAVFERYVRSVDFAGNAALAVSQFPKAPLGVGFGGSAALSISAPIPVIPREVTFGGEVVLAVESRVGGPNVAAYTSGSGLDNWIVTLPPAATGDLRIIIIGLVAKSSAVRSGWVKLGEDSSWYDPGIAVHYRYRRALDPDTVTLDVGGYGDASTVVALTIPGAMVPTIFGTAKSYSSGAPGPHTTPAITTTKANSLAIRAVVGNPDTRSFPTYSGWGSPMTELVQQQSVAAGSTANNSVMTVATGPAAVVGVQPAVTVNPSIGMPYMGAAFAIEPLTIIAGMHLATQHTLVSSGTQTQIVGWSADQGSTVTSDRLVIPVTKTGAKVEVFIRYQTNSATGSPSFQWRLLKNATATQLDSVTVSGAGVGTNYEAVMTYTGNFVAGDYIYLTCSGTFVAPAPFVIPGVDTFVRVT